MPLTAAQQDAVLNHLEQAAQDTLARINNSASGFFHNLISGDDGGGGRTECKTVLKDTIPSLRRTAERDRTDDDSSQRWLGNALEAEDELKAVDGYVAGDTVMQILKKTETATGQDLRDKADQVVKGVASAVPWYVYLGGAALLFVYVGGLRRS